MRAERWHLSCPFTSSADSHYLVRRAGITRTHRPRGRLGSTTHHIASRLGDLCSVVLSTAQGVRSRFICVRLRSAGERPLSSLSQGASYPCPTESRSHSGSLTPDSDLLRLTPFAVADRTNLARCACPCLQHYMLATAYIALYTQLSLPITRTYLTQSSSMITTCYLTCGRLEP